MKKYQTNIKEMQESHQIEIEKLEKQVSENHTKKQELIREKMEIREELFSEQEKYRFLENKLKFIFRIIKKIT